MKKRLLAILLTAAMLLTVMPVTGYAADSSAEAAAYSQDSADPASDMDEPAECIAASSEQSADVLSASEDAGTFCWINPVYADVITEGDLAETGEASLAEDAELLKFRTIKTAGAYLRSQMKARTAEISFLLADVEEMGTSCVYEIGEAAQEHTGISDEGDYLRYELGGYCASWSNYGADDVYCITYTVTYYTDTAQETAVTEKIRAVLDELQISDQPTYEKIRSIYDYICANVTYDYENLEDDSYKLKYTAYAALLNGTAVCQGYAVLLYRMLLEAGIDCRLIGGTAHGSSHAWNIVQIGPVYYNLDATWDAEIAPDSYLFFLKSTDNFAEHERDSNYTTDAFAASYPMSDSDFTAQVCTAHTWDEGAVTREPTVRADGLRTYTCTVCGDTFTEVIDLLPSVAEGQCGYNAYWILDTNGTLFISGEGQANVVLTPDSLWNDYADSIVSVVVEKGITSIGDKVFKDLKNLKQVTIADDVTWIGLAAFKNCCSLTAVTIPEGVTGTGSSIFENCTALQSVQLPTTLTSLNNQIFYNCKNLTSVNIPDTVTYIGTLTFAGCSSLTSVNIPDLVGNTGNNIFEGCTGLQSVSVGSGLTTLRSTTFQDCTALNTVTINGAATEIEDYALGYDGSGEKLAGFTIYGYENSPAKDYAETNGIAFVSLGEAAVVELASGSCGENVNWSLKNNGTLTLSGSGSMELDPEEETPWSEYLTTIRSVTAEAGVTGIADSAFANCSSLRSVTLSDGLQTIGDHAFSNCTTLTSITMPDSVTKIGSSAFSNCQQLPTIQLSKGLSDLSDGIFCDCRKLEKIQIPEGVTQIGERAFSLCDSLTSIELPDGVTKIGIEAFYECSALKSVTLPEGLLRIEDSAFGACISLTEIVIPDSVCSLGSGYDSSGANVFAGCSSLQSITIGCLVPIVTVGNFEGCSSLSSVTLNGSTTEIEAQAIGYDSNHKKLADFTIYGYENSEAQAYAVSGDLSFVSKGNAPVVTCFSGTCRDNLTWELDSTRTLTISGSGSMFIDLTDTSCNFRNRPWDPYSIAVGTVVVAQGVTAIDTCAFEQFWNLKAVSLPDGLLRIGMQAFSYCPRLTEISIPDSVSWIGSGCFYDCSGLQTVHLPVAMTSLSSSMFSYCTALTDVTIPESVTSIGANAFSDCTALTALTLPESVTRIGARFLNNTPIMEQHTEEFVVMNGSLVAYQGSETEIVIPDGVTYIGDELFMSGNITGVTIPDSVTGIGSFAFAGCNLSSVTLPDHVAYIGDGAFCFCSITSVSIPDSVTYIGDDAFPSACYSQTDEFVIYGSCLVKYNGSANKVTVPEGVTKINACAFSGSAVTEVTLPATLREIGQCAFSNCKNLTAIILPASLECINVSALEGTSNVEIHYAGTQEQWNRISCRTFDSFIGGIGFDNGRLISTVEKLFDLGGKEHWIGITDTENIHYAKHYVNAEEILNALKDSESTEDKIIYTAEQNAFSLSDTQQAEIYAALDDTDKTVAFETTDADGTLQYSWSFSGSTISDAGTTVDSFEMAVVEESEALRNTIQEQSLDQCIAVQFTHEGALPGPAEISLHVGSTYPDGTYDLYYYNAAEDTLEKCESQAVVKDGIAVFTITHCSTYVIAHTHTWDAGEITAEATCTADGVKTCTCTVCGETKAETISALGHSYDAAVTEPTCTEAGYTTYTCSRCGDAKTEPLSALGHDYIYTDHRDGTHTGTCSHCGNTVTEEHSYQDGVCVCGAVDTSLHIITQPDGGEATIGQTVTISVEAVNAKSYQWYYSKDGGESWSKLYWEGAKTNTLSVEYKASRAALQYQCRVKGTDGTTLYTEPTAITQSVAPAVEITQQPRNVCANVGETVSFSIIAENAISYQWFYSKDGGTSWTKLYWDGADTDTITFEVKKSRYNYVYYCKLTDGNGKAYYSNRCYLSQPLSMKTQPQDVTAAIGDTVKLTVSAVGVQSYQWYYSKDGGESWSKLSWTGAKSDTLTVDVTRTRCSYVYRCVLAGFDGTELTTNTVRITAAG